MRILFYYLVLLNLLYAGWEYLRPTQTSVEVPPLSKSLATLELLEGSHNESAIELNNDTAETIEKSPERVEADEQEKSPLVCHTLGPFKDEGIMQQVKESIAEAVQDVSVRTLRNQRNIVIGCIYRRYRAERKQRMWLEN